MIKCKCCGEELTPIEEKENGEICRDCYEDETYKGN